jgi:hypothetical protein
MVLEMGWWLFERELETVMAAEVQSRLEQRHLN